MATGAAEAPPLIALRQVYKAYETAAGGFMALRDINLEVHAGEFIGVIGKSGSGKSTLINMITGIDRPTSGEVWVNGRPIHTLNENQMAKWRGETLGIVFQSFQLLPGLSVLQNVMLPLDLRGKYSPEASRRKALDLLDRVGVAEHAHKKPTEISGGQQQRVAIARALIADPAVLVADEPTGSLDSKTAAEVFALFEDFAAQGMTILLVTHDDLLARRVRRTILITDGEIVNEYLARALPGLKAADLLRISQQLDPYEFAPGQPIFEQDAPPDRFYVITEGAVNVFLHRPDGHDIHVETLRAGQYFGEMAMLYGGPRSATVRCANGHPVKLAALEHDEFADLVEAVPDLRRVFEAESARRLRAQVGVWSDWFERREQR